MTKLRMLRAAAILGGLLLMMPLVSCGDNELSAARVSAIRQSPFLYVPPSASQILVIDVNRFRQFSVYENIRRIFLRDEGRASVWNDLSRQYGDDPLTKVDQVLLAGYGTKFKYPMNDVVVVITGEWGDDEAFLESIRKLAGEGFLESPPPFEMFATEADRVGYRLTAESSIHPGEQTSLFINFPGSGICVLSVSEERFTKCIGSIFETLPSIQEDTGWDVHFEQIKLDEPIWMAGWFPGWDWRDYIKEKIQTVPELKDLWALAHNHPATFYAYLNTDAGYLLDLEMICEDSNDASLFSYDLNRARRVVPRILNSWFPQDARKIELWQAEIDKLEPVIEGPSMRFTVEMSHDEARDFIDITASKVVVTPTPLPVPDPFRRD